MVDAPGLQRSNTQPETYLPSVGGNKEVEFYINMGNLNKKIWTNPNYSVAEEQNAKSGLVKSSRSLDDRKRITSQNTKDILMTNKAVIDKITYLRDAFEVKRDQLAAKKREYEVKTNTDFQDQL